MKRFPLPDLLKGFAVFLIVPVHILETFINLPGRESLFGRILLLLGGPIAVPIFMMVMGYFIGLNKKSPLQNVVRGIFIFVLGLLLNIGLNFHLLLKIFTEGWSLDPLQFIFGVDIFYLAGLSIVILSVLKAIEKGQKWLVFGLILLVVGSTSYLNELLMVAERNYILAFIAGKYSWSYFPLFPWLAYPLLGFLFQKIELQTKELIQKFKKGAIIVLGSILIFVLAFSEFGIETTINLSEYYHHDFYFFLWALGLVILWVTLFWFIVQKFPQFPVIVFLRWLGKNITVFYVIQWLIIGNIATAIFQTQELSMFMWWYVPIFLLTVVLTWGLEKIRKVKNHSEQ
ncbi:MULTISPECIES: acyltransferase [unclassified Lentimicrobium]|uniref:acyltransferase family protein n=1 Tax=unclassified Lentimicrobium TaxID=2677434 RepID=UPI0015580EB9|nr:MULTISPECIES: acyltransferase [unclassified Lentimicrobium]NPD47099.1 acyltransferase [Lentimicrobium sp. S6]NPD85747.1 acyltransferase [Lentimicrobium sp. L6]